MAEIQSCDPRHAWKLLHRALHDDAVLIEIHIAAHIRNVAYHALFKDHDLDLCGALEFDLIFLDERDGFMLPEPVLVITERRMSGPFSAKDQIENGVAVGFPKEELLGYGVSENDLILTEAPSAEELARLDPFYMSYFVPWNSYKNYQIAKEHGFHDLSHEWDRTHHAENFDQIDSRAYLVHSWLKYPKFGHAAATDYTARYIRYGMMTREEAIPIIKERDGALDPLCVRDFCAFCGYTETEFWAIMDKFYNRDLFEKDEYGRWMLKEPIWKEN